jgi:Na+/melibiose symporter-like transporter
VTARREPSAASLLAYALPALPLAVLQLPVYVLVPNFYASGIGLPIAAIGAALLAVRIVDALLDPMIGFMADRVSPGLGRRRGWFALAALPTALAAWMLFSPPGGAGLAYLVTWSLALSLAWTAALVPYGAWGAELSTHYHGRARVAAFRETATVAGTVVALTATAAVPMLGLGGDREVLAFFALFVALALPLATALAVWRVPEPADLSRHRLSPGAGLRLVAGNRPFLRLVAAYVVNGLANGLPATLFLFYARHVLEAPDAAGPLLMLYFLCGVLGVPLWLKLARATSKHRAWAIGMLVAAISFPLASVLGPGDVWLFALVCVLTGLTLGADVVLPAAIQADVIDLDTARSGEQRSGLYLSFWGLATQGALALAVGLAFPVLGAAGFDPGSGLVTPGGVMALALLYATAPALIKLGAIALVWRFPLDAAEQARLRAAIEGRG